MKFRKINDPGHGWLEVPLSVYQKFCKRLNWKASPCSYYCTERGMVYLEEDCDASFFLERFENFEIEVKHYEDCFVRELPPIEELHEVLHKEIFGAMP